MVDINHILDANIERARRKPEAHDGYFSYILNDEDIPTPKGFREYMNWWNGNIESRCRVGADEFPLIKDTSIVTTFIGCNGTLWETWVRKWNVEKPPANEGAWPPDFEDFMWWTDTKEKAIESHRNALLMVLLTY